jgi:hypothetical protein
VSAAAAAILRLLASRRPEATICPSEAARALDPEAWRGRMGEVHAAARGLAAAGAVELAQRGAPVAPEAARGAYRIRRPGAGAAR